jgi:hypothetical protein
VIIDFPPMKTEILKIEKKIKKSSNLRGEGKRSK